MLSVCNVHATTLSIGTNYLHVTSGNSNRDSEYIIYNTKLRKHFFEINSTTYRIGSERAFGTGVTYGYDISKNIALLVDGFISDQSYFLAKNKFGISSKVDLPQSSTIFIPRFEKSYFRNNSGMDTFSFDAVKYINISHPYIMIIQLIPKHVITMLEGSADRKSNAIRGVVSYGMKDIFLLSASLEHGNANYDVLLNQPVNVEFNYSQYGIKLALDITPSIVAIFGSEYTSTNMFNIFNTSCVIKFNL